MKSRKAIADAIRKKLNFAVDSPLRDQLLAHALREQEQSQETEPAVNRPAIRRMIMKNSIVKLGVAAAIIALFGVGIVEFLGTGGTSGVVWAEVAQKVQASRGVCYRATDRIVPDTYDQEADFSMQYSTDTQLRIDRYKGGRIVETVWDDCNAKTTVLVDHDHKSYVKTSPKESPKEETSGCRGMADPDPTNLVQEFLSRPHKELGRKTIGGLLCEGIGTEYPADDAVARLWVSVETKYPVQWEGDRVRGGAHHTRICDQFQWDAEFDENLFVPVIPEGYIDVAP